MPGGLKQKRALGAGLDVPQPVDGDQKHLLRRVVRIGRGKPIASQHPPSERVVLSDESLDALRIGPRLARADGGHGLDTGQACPQSPSERPSIQKSP